MKDVENTAGEEFIRSCVTKVFSTVFLLVSIYFMGMVAAEFIAYWYYSSWPKTDGVILESNVIEKEFMTVSGRSISYDNHLLYEYQVEGERYTSSRFSNKRLIRLDTDKYAKGSNITVLYNPFNHSKSILEPKKDLNRISAIVPAIFFLIPFIVLRFFYSKKSKNISSDKME